MSEIPSGIFGVLISFAKLASFIEAVSLTELTEFGGWRSDYVESCRSVLRQRLKKRKNAFSCIHIQHTMIYNGTVITESPNRIGG